MLITLIGTTSLSAFDSSLTTLALLCLLSAIAVVTLIILIGEYGATRGGRRSQIPEQQRQKTTQSIGNDGVLGDRGPPGVGPFLADEEPQAAPKSERGRQWQPSLSTEKRLQVAAGRAGIDIRILRSWAEQQRLRTQEEDFRRAILKRLIEIEEAEHRKRAGKGGV